MWVKEYRVSWFERRQGERRKEYSQGPFKTVDEAKGWATIWLEPSNLHYQIIGSETLVH